MKKSITSILLISLSMALFSCVNFNVSIVETIPEETKPLEEKVDIISLGESISDENSKTVVSTEKIKIEDIEDGKLYCEASYDKFNINDTFAFKYQELNAKLLDFNEKSENAAKEFIEQFSNEAKEMMQERNDDTLVLSNDSAVNILRNEDKVFSFTNGVYSYTGGVHGIYGTICYNYDTRNGVLLKNKDVFTNMDLLYERLIKELRIQDEENKEVMLFFDEYPETIKDTINQNEELSMGVCNDAVEILFDPYFIGPWSSGTITVKFNYEDNKDLLNISLFE